MGRGKHQLEWRPSNKLEVQAPPPHLTFGAGVGSPYITICADRLLAVSTLQHTREARLARATRRSVLHTAITAILGYTSIPDMVIRLQHILI